MRRIELLREQLIQKNQLDEASCSLLDEIQAELVLGEKIKTSLITQDTYMVYKHTAPDGRVYIGITSQSLQNRFLKNGTGYRQNKDLDNAIRMQGWENFKHEILDANLTREEALKIEDELMEQYDALSHGFNGRRNHRDSKSKKKQEACLNGASCGIPTTPTTNQDISTPKNEIEVSQDLIQRFSIKAWKKQFFYLRDDKYIWDKDNNFLATELLVTYRLPTKKHREIFEQIAILSRVESNDEVLNLLAEDSTPLVEPEDSVTLFYRDCIELTPPVLLYNGPLYSDYLSWCSQHDLSPLKNNWFHRRFKKVSTKIYKPFRSNSTRGYNLKSI